MTFKEAYEIIQEAKIRMTAGKPNLELEDAFDHALVALAYMACAEKLSDEISDKCQKALGEKWVAERKESCTQEQAQEHTAS